MSSNNKTVVVPEETLYRNAIYRFRLLNGDFRTQYRAYFVGEINGVNQTLNFSVIGSDSALRRHPTPVNLQTVFLSPA